ncbi:MAG TPA: Fic family protein [Verrucomicrobiota bacterium]|nr:Fic family protein [Verrucomicrobiota bacterium]
MPKLFRKKDNNLSKKVKKIACFIIENHPFTDGNKRIASFLFVYYLNKNEYLYKPSGEKKINDNILTALSLLLAISNPDEKGKFIKLITNLLDG